MNEKLNDLAKRKRRAGQDDHIISEIIGCESRLSRLQDELSITLQRMESCKSELKHVDNLIRTSKEELESVSCIVTYNSLD